MGLANLAALVFHCYCVCYFEHIGSQVGWVSGTEARCALGWHCHSHDVKSWKGLRRNAVKPSSCIPGRYNEVTSNFEMHLPFAPKHCLDRTGVPYPRHCQDLKKRST